MKVFKLPASPINLQKCLLPDSGFLQKNYGNVCFITFVTGEIYLVRIGLFEIKNIRESLFFDGSVFKKACFENSCTNFPRDRPCNISFKNLTVLKKPIIANKINVVVVFCNVLEALKFDSRKKDLVVILGNILKMFIVCNKSYLSLSAFKSKINFGIELIIVTSSDISDPLQPYEINSYTSIRIDKCISRSQFDQLHLTKKPPLLKGCDKAFALLMEMVQHASISSKIINLKKKILLIGPRGCGKTSLIYRVAAECKSILIEISLIDTIIVDNKEDKMYYILKECHFYSKQGHTCIILIKNIDLICGKKKTSNKILMRLISFLDSLKNSSKILVIATTNSVNDIDMELRKYKRFDEEIEIGIPNTKEREEIILQILTECNIKCDLMCIKKLAQRTTGFVGADLKLLVVEALIAFYNIQNSFEYIDGDILEKCFEKALTKVIPSGLRNIEGLRQTRKISFSDIGGLERVKNLLNISVKHQIEHPEKFQKLGVPLTKGILLYGPPGCAKTTLIKALAQECHIKLLEVSAAELYSPYVGDAEKNIVQLFDKARLSSPAIIFIDEIDAVVGSKCDSKEHGVQDRILSTLLVEMDGVGVKVNLKEEVKGKSLKTEVLSDGIIVIGATNRPQVLENALIRPGRFDKLIYIPPPNVIERELILQKLTVKMPLHECVDLKRLAELTNYYSGADLKNLCRECGLNAMNVTNMSEKKIHQHHFENIIKDFKPSLNENVVSFYSLFHCLSE